VQINDTRWLAITDEESSGWKEACVELPSDTQFTIIDEHTVDSTVFVTIEEDASIE
jgi:hypothetical protein